MKQCTCQIIRTSTFTAVVANVVTRKHALGWVSVMASPPLSCLLPITLSPYSFLIVYCFLSLTYLLSDSLCAVFPQQSTGNQFFTETMFHQVRELPCTLFIM